jgi:hypothetical protein
MKKRKSVLEARRGKMRLKRNSRKNVSRSRNTKTMRELLACRQAYAEVNKGYQAKLHQILQRAFIAALDLKKDSVAWKAFAQDDFWGEKDAGKRPKKKNREKPLRFALKFILGTHGKSQQQIAAKYARVLHHLAEKGVNPDRIAATIAKSGGIEKLACEAAKGKAKPSNARPEHNVGKRNNKYPAKLVSLVGGAIKKGVADGTYNDPRENDQEPAKPDAAPRVWTFVASEKVDRALDKLKSGGRLRGVTLRLLPEDHWSGANMRATKPLLPSKEGRQE